MNEYILPTRAEEIGTKVYDYFVMPPKTFYYKMLLDKAAVLVGGRGTGKTMLLKSMALEYRFTKAEYVSEYKDDHYIGCYIRADNRIVNSFIGRGISEEDWIDLFAHYFNIVVTQQITSIVDSINKNIGVSDTCLSSFVKRYFEIVREDYEDISLIKMENSIRNQMDNLVLYINNPKSTKIEKPILIINGYLFTELCKVLSQFTEFSKKTWFIMIDEYENLSSDKQKVINTLIKSNQPPVIFKIAMKPDGWWTRETLSSTESLDITADFDLIEFENISDEDYDKLVIEVSRKSLLMKGIKDSDYLDVRELLPELIPEDEAISIFQRSNQVPKFINRIQKYIKDFTYDKNMNDRLSEQLIINEEPLKTRVHLVLLDKGYTPKDILIEKEKNSQKYKEWYKHYRIGTLYLFCSEYGIRKIYAGFNTYIKLSSKIIRSFISMLSKAIEYSCDEGYDAYKPKAISTKNQSRAAYFVSQKKVFEIERYAVIGPTLFSFANNLGRLFEQLNKDNKQSQPERNHFCIHGNINESADNLLKGALLHSVLQEMPANKLRGIDIRNKDYLLNRIYSPYYNISFRKMHKLELTAEEFSQIISASDQNNLNFISSLFKKFMKDNMEESDMIQMKLSDIL